ncbi:hypothetical protein [Facilibium subflavum]|nr:hypothetical protein [Facilibium subflavum]
MNKRETTYVNIIEEQLAEKKIAEMFVDTPDFDTFECESLIL